MITASLLGVALATPPSVAIGVDYGWDDPFVAPIGLRGGLDVSPRDWLTIGLTGAWYPADDESSWSALTDQIASANHISPDLSYVTTRAQLEARLTPIRGTSGGWERTLGGHIALGAAHTRDDLDTIGAVGDPVFEATEREWHPAPGYGLDGELWRGDWGVRLRLERTYYVEWVASDVKEKKTPSWLGLELTWRPL